MYIPAHLIEQVRAAADIVSIIGEFTELKRKGRNFWALSPFADEKTPSFSVSGEKQIFKCFSSGKGGNIFTFLIEKEGMTFPESVKWVAKRVGVEIEEKEKSAEDINHEHRRQSIMVVNAWAANQFSNWSIESAEFHDWLAERKLEESSADTFQIGVSGVGWTDLMDLGLQEGRKGDYMTLAGLVGFSEKSGKSFDRFRNRIMFPICDHYGNVIAFGGRKFLPGDKQMAKYLNSPETLVYDKSNVLYGLHLAKDHIRKKDQAILVEGYMDVVMMHQHGFKNTIAACGTALTKKQAQLIHRYTSSVLLIMDDDKAGRKASLKHITTLLSEGITVKVLTLADSDPDSFVSEQGADTMQKQIEASEDWLPWTIETLKKVNQMGVSPSDKAKLIETIDQYIRHIPWDVTQDLYRKEAANLLDVELEMVKKAEKAIPARSNQRDFDWYVNLVLNSTLQMCPDFFRTDRGDLRVDYRDMKGKPYRITIQGGKQNATRNITRSEKIQAAYIPPKLREYFSENDEMRSPVAGVPLFLVEDEVTAWMLDSIGVFAIGLPSRVGFLQKKNSKKLHGMLRQVIGQGFRHVVYIASGEMFSLPEKKANSSKPYRSIDAGMIARDYVELMKALKESFGEINAYILHPKIDGPHIEYLQKDWIEDVLVTIAKGKWAPDRQTSLESEFTSELYRMINRGQESDLYHIHNLSDNNLNYYQKIVRLHDPQAFFEFHGIEKLKDEFQLGRFLYEVNRDNEVALKQDAIEHQLIHEIDGAYWASTRQGLTQISDFTINPVLKIKGSSPWVLAQIEDRYGIPYDVVLDHKLLLNADQFHLRIYGIADCFFHGTNSQLRHLQQMIFKRMPQAYMMDKLGHQEIKQSGSKTTFYACGNGLITYDDGFLPADEKGLVEYNGETFFLPAESGFELSDDRDELYETHQKFSYESGTAKYEEWIELFFKVHQRDAAHLGFSFYLMSIYRDIIYKILGIHPNCYFQGETGTGKTTLRKSLSRLFGEAPTIFCNDNPSVAAVGSLGLQASNALVILEEFNVFKLVNNRQDWIIDIAKAFYDGKSRTTRQSAQNDFLKNKSVKGALLTCGQEPFYQYDEAVNNRFVMVEFHERDFDTEAYYQLKYMEDGGIFNITEDLLKHRKFIEENFRQRLQEVEANLTQRLKGRKVLERLVQNWAIVITPLLMLVRGGHISYPIQVREILEMATQSILAHANKAYKKGILGEFWAFIESTYGRKIDDRDIFVYQNSELRIRFRSVLNHFKEYIRGLGDRTIDIPSESNLRKKLEKHEAFLNETQTWMGFKRDAEGRILTKTSKEGSLVPVYQKKQCMCFDLSILGLNLTEISALGQIDEGDEEKIMPVESSGQTALAIAIPTAKKEYYNPT